MLSAISGLRKPPDWCLSKSVEKKREWFALGLFTSALSPPLRLFAKSKTLTYPSRRAFESCCLPSLSAMVEAFLAFSEGDTSLWQSRQRDRSLFLLPLLLLVSVITQVANSACVLCLLCCGHGLEVILSTRSCLLFIDSYHWDLVCGRRRHSLESYCLCPNSSL